jgi:tetratricopeptide (TPR) repeat protein/tRNA A-37 threonylcarbamoyl transferase component Bud32
MNEPDATTTFSSAGDLVRQVESLWAQGQRPDPEALLKAAGVTSPLEAARVLAADQRHRWHAGERVCVEDYFARHPALADDPAAALLLVNGELLVREELGEAPSPDCYLARFPQCADGLRRQKSFRAAVAETGSTVIERGRDTGTAGPAEEVPLGTWEHYELLEEIGRGGMGVVYKARDRKLNRLVALKMIRAGSQADAEQVMRFLTEAEAVAQLQHANIVPIFEVGRCNGLPYFTLELIGGGSLAHKLRGGPLSAATAARLLEQLAQGIHAAHQRGIVHRDLKPDNVLLAEDGTPKITDFGLAKRVEVGDGLTVTGAIMGTPSYMAPEQALGKTKSKEVGPPADIYALGAILYEMLTGRPPFRAESTLDTLQQVLNQEPVPPTRLQPRVSRDLETICLKCLRKEPGQRYASALALSEDLQRFAAGKPILARPIGRLRRLARWARRAPLAAALLGAFLMALASGLTAAGVLWWRAEANLSEARRQYSRAEESARDARAAVEQMLSEVGEERLKNIPEMEPVRRALLEKAAVFYEKFLQERGDDPAVREEAARSYGRVGLINQQLGHLQESEAAYQQSIALKRQLVEGSPDEPRYRQSLAATYFSGLGHLYLHSQQYDKAEAPLRAGLEILESLTAEYPLVAEYQIDLADCYNNLASLYLEMRQLDRAEKAHRESLTMRDQLARTHPGDAGYQDKVAGSHNNLGLVYRDLGRFDEAETALHDALAIWNILVRNHPRTLSYQEALGLCHQNLGWLYLHYLSQPSKAARALQDSLKVRERLAREHPALIDYQGNLAQTYQALAMAYGRLGQPAKVEETHLKVLQIMENPPLEWPDVPKYRYQLANTYHSLAWHYQAAGKMDKAEQFYDKSLVLRRQLAEEHPRAVEYLRTLGQVHHERGMLYATLGQFPKSVTAYEEAIRVREKLVQTPPPNPSFNQDLAWSYNNLGGTFEALGQHVRAQEVWDKALAIRQKLVESYPKVPGYAVGLAASYRNKGDRLLDGGKAEEALDWYGRGIRVLEEVLRQESHHAEAKEFLCNGHWMRANAFRRLGRYDAALEDWDRAIALDSGRRRPELRLYRAMTLAMLNDHVRATAEANELAGTKAFSGERLYQLASVYGRCAQVLPRDTKLSVAEQTRLAEEYAVRALALLVRAREAGFFKDRAALARLHRNDDLDSLRQRADFQKLLAEVEKERPNEATGKKDAAAK